MPNRIVREGILDSGRMDRLIRDASWPAAEFYRRLHSVVDDFGRFDGRVNVIRAKCYPTLLDLVREADVQRWIAACEKAVLIRLYVVDGHNYLVVLDFNQFTRAKKSKYPPPPDDMQCACSANESHMRTETETNTETYSETDSSSDPPAGAEQESPTVMEFPTHGKSKTWALTEAIVEEFRQAFPHLNIVGECTKALGWCRANPQKQKTANGMKRFLFSWLDRSQNRGSQNGGSSVGSSATTCTPIAVPTSRIRKIPATGTAGEFG